MQVVDQPVTQDAGDDDPGILHIACPCDDGEIALCGTDVSSAEWEDADSDEEADCIVCYELAEQGCPRCGEKR